MTFTRWPEKGRGTVFKQREGGEEWVEGNPWGCYKAWVEEVESEGNLAVRTGRMSKRSFGGTGAGLCNAFSDAQYCGGCSGIRLPGRKGPRGQFQDCLGFLPSVNAYYG